MDLDTPLGKMRLHHAEGALLAVDREATELLPGATPGEDSAWKAAFSAYFADGQFRFSLPLFLKGTPFQQRVWQALEEIPPGETRTYGEMAKALKTSAQAVGNACRANPCAIVVPCHRVVGGFRHGWLRWIDERSGSGTEALVAAP
jgi:methylated-DNA-[protein]-cysteine S-methyltransferase